MSTYWGLRCLTCQKETGTALNHGEQILKDLVSMIPEIVTIRRKDTQGYVEISLLGGFDGNDDVELFDWLCEHAGHEFAVYNEYGVVQPLAKEEQNNE